MSSYLHGDLWKMNPKDMSKFQLLRYARMLKQHKRSEVNARF